MPEPRQPRTAERQQTAQPDLVEQSDANLPATTTGEPPAREQPLSAAEQNRLKIAGFIDLLERRKPDIIPFLHAQGITWDLYIAGARRAFMRDPDLVKVTPVSFMQALMDCARVGLIPDGKRAAILSFKGVAQLVIMYEGFLEVIYKAGQINKVHCQVVYKGEEQFLDYDLGDEPRVDFRPPLDRDDSQPIVGAFAVATSADGGKWVELMGAKELAKVAAINKAKNGPGKSWPGEMARKAPLRRLIKYLPKTPQLVELLEVDDTSYLSLDEAREERRSDPRRISDADVLGDAPARLEAPDLEGETIDGIIDGDAKEVDNADQPHASLGPDDAVAGTAAIEAMLNAAPDAETREERFDAIQTDPEYGWEDLGSEDRARVEMLMDTLREQDMMTGDPRPLKINGRDGREKTYANGDLWRSAMLAKLSMPAGPDLRKWWEANLANVEAACVRSPSDAGKVVVTAVTKGLPGAGELVDKHGPFG